jgi:hypothetical protein
MGGERVGGMKRREGEEEEKEIKEFLEYGRRVRVGGKKRGRGDEEGKEIEEFKRWEERE